MDRSIKINVFSVLLFTIEMSFEFSIQNATSPQPLWKTDRTFLKIMTVCFDLKNTKSNRRSPLELLQAYL